MNETINSIKNIHTTRTFLSTFIMQAPLYSRALHNARLAHQKSMPTLSPHSDPSPNMPRKSSSEPNPRQYPPIDPPPKYPPPVSPVLRSPTAPMVKLPGGGEVSLSV